MRSCEGRGGWSDPAPPAHIWGNSYYVGSCGISVILVSSEDGHLLIDGATAEAVPGILDNIRALGFDPSEVKIMVGSHEHMDHMGGFARLKAATGAQLLAREPAALALATGETDPADPQAGIIPDMEPVVVDRIIEDQEIVRLGDIALRAIATPGHTAGGTSWTWNSCDSRGCVDIVFADSLSAVSADSYRFIDNPERVAPYWPTFDRIAELDCDILITTHPGFSRIFQKLSGAEAVVDESACQRLADASRQALRFRLDREAAR